jgi:hypothetical protein
LDEVDRGNVAVNRGEKRKSGEGPRRERSGYKKVWSIVTYLLPCEYPFQPNKV